MTTLAISLSGPARACAAVTAALAALPLQELRAAWVLRELPCGRVEIHGDGRYTVAATWAHAVQVHLAPPVPLASIRVAPWGTRR